MYKFYLYHLDVGRWFRIVDPVGWDSLGKKISRDLKWHGIFFEYLPKLKFIKNGRGFIQFFYEKYGIETDVLLRIDKLDTLTNRYEVDYVGTLNLTTYKLGTIFLEVNVENTGFLQKLKNRQDVKVDISSLVSQGSGAIPAFSNESRNITMHSRALAHNYSGKIPPDQIYGNGGSQVLVQNNEYLQFDFVDDYSQIETKYTYPIINTTNKPYENIVFSEPGTYAFTISLLVDLVKFPDPSGQFNFYLQKNDDAPDVFNYTMLCLDSGAPAHRLFLFTISKSYTIVKGDKVTWYAKNTTGNLVYVHFPSPTYFLANGCSLTGIDTVSHITILGQTYNPTSTCKTQFIHEAWARVLQSITDTKDPLRSNYYGRTDSEPNTYAADGEGSLRAITNGNQLRLIDKPIYLSFKELFEAGQAIDGIGIGIERINYVERVRIEPLTYFYQAKRLMQLPNVLNIEKDVATEMYYNEVDGGIDKWTNEKETNQDEFTGKRTWAFPITKIKNKLLLKSSIITSGSSLEVTRRKSNDTSKDTETDNDNFMIQLRRNAGFEPDRNQDFTTVTGLIDPSSAYNLKLSPLRCLKRNARMLRAFLDKYTSKKLKLNYTEGNTGMVSRLSTETANVTEGADVLISDLDKPLYLAEFYNIRARLTRQQLIDMQVTDPAAEKNVWQYIEFSYNDKDWLRGYIAEAKPNPVNMEVELKLLRAAL